VHNRSFDVINHQLLNMKQRVLSIRLAAWAAWVLVAVPTSAAIPPAAKLLPKDTLAVLTVPDWSGSSTQTAGSSFGKLWSDSAMKPFRDHFEAQFNEKILGKMEKDLGIKTADYLPLLQGQLTFAVVADGWDGSDPKKEPHLVMILDAKDKAPELKKRLEEVRKKLADAGRNPKTEKIRDVEFTTVVIEPAPAAKAADADEDEDEVPAAKPSKQTYVFGQVESALLIADAAAPLEKLVARISGGSVPTLSEEASFTASEPRFRDAQVYGWVHWTPVSAGLTKSLAENEMFENVGTDATGAFKALGLSGLRTLTFTARVGSDGTRGDFSLNIPEAERRGLFKMLGFGAKDSAPLPFVPADVTQFMRLRVDWRKFIATVEETLQSLSPQMGGMFNMMVGAAGKDKDPNFDLRKSLFTNLGDDLMMYQRPATGSKLEDLQNAPSLTLLSSPGADDLVTGVKALTGLAPGAGAGSKEREVAGKKIQSLPMPMPGKPDSRLEYVGSGGYVAFSRQPAMIEEYIRSSDGVGKSLKENSEMTAAAEKVGGLGTGFFAYENQRESMRSMWGMLRNDGLAKSGMGGGEFAELFDFKKLPEFDQVRKFFGISVTAGLMDAQGVHLQSFAPTPK